MLVLIGNSVCAICLSSVDKQFTKDIAAMGDLQQDILSGAHLSNVLGGQPNYFMARGDN